MPKKAGSVLSPASPQKNSKKAKKSGKEPPLYNYEAIAESPEFVALKKKKRNFILPITIFFLLFYISLPILTSYTTILNKPAIGDITWVWVFALAQFIMTWTLCMIYVRKAEGFDKDAEEIIKKEKAGDYV
ncbi:MAG: DUF485 domain-containing protein [Psychrobacillus sp.]